MPRSNFRIGALVCLAASLLTGVALAQTPLVVPDQGNNRVLIYFTPIIGNDQPANIVLGQTDFASSAAGTSSTTMNGPTAFAFDANGNLFVSDSGNCRVLMFATPFTTGEAASLVIGEPDLNTACNSTIDAKTTSKTGGVTIQKGNLWVADSGNSRVLKFLAPLKNGESAKVVVGEPDFVSNGGCVALTTAASLCNPIGITFDSGNVLWVADTGNSRVLGYRNPVKGGSATVEYGHPAATAFTSSAANDGGISASSLDSPIGIGFDPNNRLWVADTDNSRVLIFARNFHVNGLAASIVLGQPDSVSSIPNQGGSTGAATLYLPQGIVPFGDNVWVGDSSNNRTLQFTLPVSNDASASLVLGQPDLVSGSANQGGSPSNQTQNEPFDAGPSLIALAVLAMMAGGWQLRRRLQRAS
jgi:sugar lactone lactonase YvrE